MQHDWREFNPSRRSPPARLKARRVGRPARFRSSCFSRLQTVAKSRSRRVGRPSREAHPETDTATKHDTASDKAGTSSAQAASNGAALTAAWMTNVEPVPCLHVLGSSKSQPTTDPRRRMIRHLTRRGPKPQTPNPKPQTPNPITLLVTSCGYLSAGVIQ